MAKDRGDLGTDQRIDAVMQGLQMVKQELSHRAKFSVYWSVSVPILNSGHTLCVVSQRMLSCIQVEDIRLLHRAAGLCSLIV